MVSESQAEGGKEARSPRGSAPLCLETTAGADPIEVAVDEELEQISRRIARPTCWFGFDPSKAGRLQVKPIHEGLDEPHRIVRADVVVDVSGKSSIWERS